MMTLKVQLIIGVVLILVFIIIMNLIRKRKFELKYALLWLLLVGALFIINLFPNLMNQLAALLGISSPVNMIFFLGFCFSLAIIFILTLLVSNLYDKLKQLAQAQAVAEKNHRELIDTLKNQIKAIENLEKNKDINGNEGESFEEGKN